MRMFLDIAGIVMTAIIMIVSGLVFYAAREYLKQVHKYVFGITVSMFVALVWSYFLCYDFGFGDGAKGALVHSLVFIGLWLFYCYLFRCSFRMAKFLNPKRDDYSLSHYFKWRKGHMKTESLSNDMIDYHEPAYNVMIYSLLIGIGAFIISLAFIYVPSSIVTSDYAIDDPIEHCNVYISKDTRFYSGLPTSENQVMWNTGDSFVVLSDVTVSLVTDRRDVNCTYWRIDYLSLSDSEKKKLPGDFCMNYGLSFVEGWRVIVTRYDGKVIQ